MTYLKTTELYPNDENAMPLILTLAAYIYMHTYIQKYE